MRVLPRTLRARPWCYAGRAVIGTTGGLHDEGGRSLGFAPRTGHGDGPRRLRSTASGVPQAAQSGGRWMTIVIVSVPISVVTGSVATNRTSYAWLTAAPPYPKKIVLLRPVP